MASNKFFDKKLKIGLGVLGFLILLNLIFLIFFNHRDANNNPTVSAIINNKSIKAEVVSGSAKQYLGLSNRQSLCSDCGMLFVFSDFDVREFVMRNMNFPLDIIFISRGKIINIAENLKPEGSNPGYIYKSLAPADMVLEVNGNDAKKYGYKTGDTILINN